MLSPDQREDTLQIHQDARMYAGLLDGEQTAHLALDPKRCAYVHIVRGTLVCNEKMLSAGDGIYLQDQPFLHLS